MQYVNGLNESLVINFLKAFVAKGSKFETKYYFDEMCDFGWIYEIIVKNKNESQICMYKFNIQDFSFIGTISHGKNSVERFDYSEEWQEYVYRLLNMGILKAIKGNQKTYKEDCDMIKENRSNAKL
ncbi:MAG: hypothetical protein IKA36_03075 [Clostridia bacterium]|nr:hypothetical protein [Clostridia bacterium]